MPTSPSTGCGPLVTSTQVVVSGVPTTYAKSARTWDASYRVPATDELWFDNVDGNRAITSYVYDMATGNLTSQTDPRGNAISFELDDRKLFVIAREPGLHAQHGVRLGVRDGHQADVARAAVRLLRRGPRHRPARASRRATRTRFASTVSGE